jgi:hypothetical protein
MLRAKTIAWARGDNSLPCGLTFYVSDERLSLQQCPVLIGVELARINDDRLGALVREGFLLVTAKDRRARTAKPSRRRTGATTP